MDGNRNNVQVTQYRVELSPNDLYAFAEELNLLSSRLKSQFILKQSFSVVGKSIIATQRNMTEVSRVHLSEEKTISMGIQICKAAEAYVEVGYLHGNINPEFVYRDRGNFFLGGMEGAGKGNVIRGLPCAKMYCAPEQLEGITTERSCVFSIGVLMYQMLCPCNYPCPISNPSNEKLLAVISDKAKRIPMKPIPGVFNKRLMSVILRACSMEEIKRYPSIRALRNDLEKITVSSYISNVIRRTDITILPDKNSFSPYQNECADEIKKIISERLPIKGRYSVDRLIGCGGGGIVFLGKDRSNRKEVAIKCITSPSLKDGFLVEIPIERAEREIEANIKEVKIHKECSENLYVANIIDHGTVISKGRATLVVIMERLHGVSAANLNSPIDVAAMALDICGAIKHIHGKGYTHRDIKPQNILYSSAEKVFKLTDFGVARWMTETEYASKHGTSIYMAPEVYYGRYSNKVDIYSLGLSMYCLLNQDRIPFLTTPPNAFTKSDLDKATDKRVLNKQPIPSLRNIPGKLWDIINKATMYEPALRYQTIEDMADALRTFLEEYE